jgi:hypothetical protein
MITPFDVDPQPTRLRAKIDGIYRDSRGFLWIMEHKTKSSIDSWFLGAQLAHDFQTRYYSWIALNALQEGIIPNAKPSDKFGGVLYNVVKRPTIRQRKKESEAEFYKRLKESIDQDPDKYFHRYECSISEDELVEWADLVLFPTLQEMADWFVSLQQAKNLGTPDLAPKNYKNTTHCNNNYGLCKYFLACTTNKTDGFVIAESPFDYQEK